MEILLMAGLISAALLACLVVVCWAVFWGWALQALTGDGPTALALWLLSVGLLVSWYWFVTNLGSGVYE